MPHPYKTEKDILNGRFTLITELNEFAMSLWVNGFGITDNTSNEKILDIPNSFHLDELEEKDNLLHIVFRIYPDGFNKYFIVINPQERTFIYKEVTYKLNDFTTVFEKK